MKLGLVIYGGIDATTGGYLYDRMLVDHLRRNGHAVEILSLAKRSYLDNIYDNFDPLFCDRLRGLDADILLQDELNHPSLFYVNQRLKNERSYKIVSIIHHLSCSAAMSSQEMDRCRYFERLYLQTLDGCIFNSHITKEEVSKLLPDPPEGVVVHPGKDHLPIIRRRDTAKFSAPILKLLYLGNIVPHKGLDILVEALSRVQDRNFLLNVVGAPLDKPYFERIKEKIAGNGLGDKVNLLGFISQEELQRYFLESHILAVPSYYEGYGIAYVEALGYGLPVIATNAGGAKEIITHGKEGFLVSPGDSDGIAQHISNLLNHREKIEEMSKSAYERFDALPTWKESMDLALRYLNSLTK